MKVDFPLIAFTADMVAKLTGLSVAQLHRWDRTGFFIPAFADANRRRSYSGVYSFADIVALQTIAQLRHRGVSFVDLKRVRQFFEGAPNEDWTNRRFYLAGNRVFFQHGDAILAAKPAGQSVEPAVLELAPIVKDAEEAVRRLSERTEEEIGKISRDRFIIGGVPIVAGTRIPTATVEWFVRNDYTVDEIIKEFPRLTPDDIQAAVDYENEKRKKAEAAA